MQHLIANAFKPGLTTDALLAVIDQLPFCCLIKDESLVYRAVNQEFAALLRYAPQDMIGKRARDIVPDDAEHFEARELRVLETGNEDVSQETLPNPMGIMRDYLTKVSRVITHSGERLICITLLDVTDLNRARVRAQRADRLKSEFLANMSHEIRTPLNGVLGMAELLMTTDLTERQKGLTDIIASSGAQLLRVIDDVLDFSHIEAGEVTLSPSLFVLEDAVDEVVGLLAPSSAAKGVKLFVRLRPDAPVTALADEARVRQVLTNLTSNAIKFTDEGHVLVEVGQEGDELIFAIEDTGPGVRPGDEEEIFKKFVRSGQRDGRPRGGAGLGLTISHSLVRLMGGRIGVEPAQNGGARFWFTLPYAQATRPPPEKDGLVVVCDRHPIRGPLLLDRLARWGRQGALTTPDAIPAEAKVVIVGPSIDPADCARHANGAGLIKLTPISEANIDGVGPNGEREIALPLRGAQLRRLIEERLAEG